MQDKSQKWYLWMIWFFCDVTGLRLIGDVIGCNTFFRFCDVIGAEQVWWLSINLQTNKVIILGQISQKNKLCTYSAMAANAPAMSSRQGVGPLLPCPQAPSKTPRHPSATVFHSAWSSNTLSLSWCFESAVAVLALISLHMWRASFSSSDRYTAAKTAQFSARFWSKLC